MKLIGFSQNDNCLILISSLIRIKGIKFFFPNENNLNENNKYIEYGDKKIKLMDDIQFLTLVTHITCTETRVLLDNYKDKHEIIEMELKEEEKLKLIKDQERIQEMLPICFEIIEFMINLLVQYSEYDNKDNTVVTNEVYTILEKNNINSKWILSLREALSETILALMEFITEKTVNIYIYKYSYLYYINKLIKFIYQQIYQETQNIESIDNIIVLLSTRILSSWLSENIEMFEKESIYIIPALIEIAKIK